MTAIIQNSGYDQQVISKLVAGEAGTIKRVTSYTSAQTEVAAMLALATNPDLYWPGPVYEIVQGAIENNDYKMGKPRVAVYLNGDANAPHSIWELKRLLKSGRRPIVDEIQVLNHCKETGGLDPNHLTTTFHDQGPNTTPYSEHGRGFKIATAAICTLSKANGGGVSIASYRPGWNRWTAQALMEVDPDLVFAQAPDRFPPALGFAINLAPRSFPDDHLTRIGIHKPHSAIVEGLLRLEQWFLPANPAYHACQIETATAKVPQLQPIFTLYVEPPNNTRLSDTAAALELADVLTHGIPVYATDLEPPRIEILDKRIVGLDPSVGVDFMYVNGLRLVIPGARFRHLWATWGVGGPASDFTARRGNDSIRAINGPYRALSLALARCPVTQVWEDLFQQTIGAGPDSKSWHPTELALAKDELKTVNSNGPARKALERGYRAAGGHDLVTDSAYNVGVARTVLGRNATYLPSTTALTAVAAAVSGTIYAGKAIQEDATKKAAQLAEAQKALNEEKLKNERHELAMRGLSTPPARSKEAIRIRIKSTEEGEALAQKLIANLAYILAEGDGFVNIASDSLILRINLRKDIDLDSGTLREHLGYVCWTAVLDWLEFPYSNDFEVRITPKTGPGRYFLIHKFDDPETKGTYVSYSTAEMKTVDPTPGVKLVFNPIPGNTNFQTIFLNAVGPFLEKGTGKVLRELYRESDLCKRHPFSAALFFQEQRLEETKKRFAELQAEQLAEINAQRELSGLTPLLALPSQKPKQSPRTPSAAPPPHRKPAAVDTALETHVIRRTSRGNRLVPIISVPPIRPEGLQMEGNTPQISPIFNGNKQQLERALRERLMPSLTLIGPTQGYLIGGPITNETTITLGDYLPMGELPFMDHRGHPTILTYNGEIPTGLSVLWYPPGFRPVGYYHPLGIQEIMLSGRAKSKFFAFYSPADIPPGLQFMYEPDTLADTSQPDEIETSFRTQLDKLLPQWQSLITTLNEDTSLTPKRKVDILLMAWVRAFSYKKDKRTIELYKQFAGNNAELYAATINYARGTCAHARRAVTALTPFIGIPSRPLSSFLSDESGNISLSHNSHGILRLYIEGKWVLVEPQLGYLEPGVTIAPLTPYEAVTYLPLIKSIPLGRSVDPERLTAPPPLINVPKTAPNPELQELWNTTVRALEREGTLSNASVMYETGGSARFYAETSNDAPDEPAQSLSAADRRAKMFLSASISALIATLIMSVDAHEPGIVNRYTEIVRAIAMGSGFNAAVLMALLSELGIYKSARERNSDNNYDSENVI